MVGAMLSVAMYEHESFVHQKMLILIVGVLSLNRRRATRVVL